MADVPAIGGFLYTGLFCYFFIGCCQHQLDAVQLVYFTGAGVVIHGNDIGSRICLSELLDHSFPHYMVGKAAEWLCTDDIRHIVVDQFDHFTGQEPALASLVAGGYKGFRVFCQFVDRRRCVKPIAGFQCPAHRLSEVFQKPDGGFAQCLARLAKSQVIGLKYAVKGAVHKEIQHIRTNRFGAL